MSQAIGPDELKPKPLAANRIAALDGWRTISISLVIAFHLMRFSSIAQPWAAPLGDFGALGVQAFFVISGFVIGRGLLTERAAHGRVSLSSFWIRRVCRIVPPLILYASFVALMGIAHVIDVDPTRISRTLTFTCNLPNSDCGGYFGKHTWSLSYEEQFYLLAPLLFVFGRPRLFIGALMVSLPLLEVGLHAAGYHTAGAFLHSFTFIAAGLVCAALEPQLRQIAEGLPAWSCWTPGVFVLALFFAPASGVMTAVSAALMPISVAALVIGTSMRGSQWLAARPMVVLGRASYGIYLWQQLATAPYPGAGASFYVLSVSASILLALLLFRHIEQPTIRASSDLSRRVRPSGPVSMTDSSDANRT